LAQDSRCDNVLLEYRLAIELSDRGLLERIYPVMIGDIDAISGAYGNYFSQGCHPVSSPFVVVRAVEDKLAEHLEVQGLGLALREELSVKSVLDAITINQGGFVQGQGGVSILLDAQADIITEMVRKLEEARDEDEDGNILSPIEEALAAKDEANARAAAAEAAMEALKSELEEALLQLSLVGN